MKSVTGMAAFAAKVTFFQSSLGLSKNLVEISWETDFIGKTTEIIQMNHKYDAKYVDSVKKNNN